jgi:hypothetical protein
MAEFNRFHCLRSSPGCRTRHIHPQLPPTMKTSLLSGILLTALTALAPLAHAVNYIDILPGSHNVLITRVTYEVDGEIVVQNAPAMGVAVTRNAPVYLKSVTIQDNGVQRTLDSHNSLGASVTNLGLTTATRGVGVFDNGVRTQTDNLDAFKAALAGTTQDTDLMNYSYYDFVTQMPAPGVADYDLLFQRGFKADDYLLVSERWGNTHFTLTPLDASGGVIIGANTLRFGYPTGDAYTKYDWNSGYAASTYVSDQAMAFTVASVAKFFEGSQTTPQTVFGFRVDNDGEADVKFIGLSNSPFNDNPPIPEPSSALLAAMTALGLMLRRKR